MNKLNEEKVFRDPIHGYVRVDESVIWQCIKTREFQRLRRIRQLGSTSMAYHTGEHTRFAHSLGVYEIVRRMVNEVPDIRDRLSDYEKLTVMLAGLLHDVGHAPFSHSFESILKTNHENYTLQIIRQPSQIHDALLAEAETLPEDVASVIEGTHKNSILCQLVSSQLDADRMDYLLRDSYFTGTKYGEFDLERVLRTMRIANDKVVVKVSGMHTIEDYIMARYHMYWQVYYHPVSRSYDCLLIMIFKRVLELYKKDSSILQQLPMYKSLLENEMVSNEDFYPLEDATCFYSFHIMQTMEDPILSDLAERILNRNLFKYTSIEKKDELLEKCHKKGFDPEYYIYQDHQSQNPYSPYNGQKNSIWVLMEDGSIKELSTVSKIVYSICQNRDEYHDEKVFYPKEVL